MTKIYIRSSSQGRFIGECIGLGFFESSITDGTCSLNERPIEFPTKEEAQQYLDSWVGGKADCFVSEEEQ